MRKLRKHIKNEDKKTPITWSTHFWVIAYTIGYMVLTVLYCLPRLLVQIMGPNFNPWWLSATATSGIPLEIFAWGLLAICAGYSGIDRASLATKSSMMEVGCCDMGDPAKLRSVMYLLCAVFIENVALNFFFGQDFTKMIATENAGELVERVYPGLRLPLEGVGSALMSTIVVYVLGNKSIRLTQTMDHTKADEDWADEKEDRVYVKDAENAQPAEKSDPIYYEDSRLGL